MDKLIAWSFDIVPNLSFNMERDPFWSPDLYQAIVWDSSLSLECSAKAKFKLEFARMAYISFDVEATVIRWAMGVQQFLSEESPPHLCHMSYTDSKIATIGFNVETNTKDCKMHPKFLEKFSLHYDYNMDT